MSLVDELRSSLGLDRPPGSVRLSTLTRLAESVLLRLPARPPGMDPTDLAQDFLLELLDRGQAVQDDLLARDPYEMRAIVRRRLRQLAVEAAPQWDRYRALRNHVAEVLLSPLPPAPVSAPLQLERPPAGRLSRTLVREAVAWMLSRDGQPPKDTSIITRHLMQLYYPPDQPMEGTDADLRTLAWMSRHPESTMYPVGRIALRGALLAKELRRHVPPSELEALCGVYEGETLQQTADRLGVAVSTIWERQRRAAERVRRLIARHGFSAERTVAVAFDLLAKDDTLRRIVGYYVKQR